MNELVNNTIIYIPIWLDLLCNKEQLEKQEEKDLHSNMVRFIIYFCSFFCIPTKIFTFQYG